LEHVTIGDEALAHEAEAHRHLILLVGDVAADDGRGTQLPGGGDELVQLRLVGQRGRVGQAAVDLVGDGGVVVDRQVVGGADEEDGRLVDALPDVERRFAARLATVERSHDEQRASRLPPRRLGIVTVDQVEGHAPVPHHGPKVALKVLVAGVVAARYVLAVVLAVAKDGGEGDPLVGLNERQFVPHDVAHGAGYVGIGGQQFGGDGEEGQVL